jgi:ATP/ADP translocase
MLFYVIKRINGYHATAFDLVSLHTGASTSTSAIASTVPVHPSVAMLTSDLAAAKTIKVLRVNMAQSFKVPYKELPRVLFHGLLLSSIIAGFWLLDSLKDPIVANTIGIEYQPIAKLMSVVSTLVIVCLYDFLTSVVSKPTLFHIVSGFFGLATMVIAALLTDPKHGLGNEDIGPHRILGWVAFCVIESYGSLMVALFWSFTNSIMDLEQAKGAYGLIIATAQLGAIVGSTLATNASTIGISQLFIISSVMIFSVSLLIKCYHLTFRDQFTEASKARVRSVSESSAADMLLHHAAQTWQERPHIDSVSSTFTTSTAGFEDDEEEITEITQFNPLVGRATSTNAVQSIYTVLGGFGEGLLLLFRYPYMIKLLGVSCLYEVVMTILDYQFKVLGSHSKQAHSHNVEAGDGFAQLLGHFGQFTNLLSFLLSFFGFSYLVHNLGVRQSLLIFPTVLFVAVVVTNLVPSLWVLFVVVSIMKAMIFSLQDPIHELLYIPTTDAIKFKVKAWIDVFGSRLAKALGSTVCTLAGANPAQLRRTAEIPSLLVAAAIVLVTYFIGLEFEHLVATKTFIGADVDPARLNPAAVQLEALSAEYMNYREGNGNNTATGDVEMSSIASRGSGRVRSQAQYPDRNDPAAVRNGLRPGDVGYDGYDLHLFEGVFEEDNPMQGAAKQP